jgi:hypothetical protein
MKRNVFGVFASIVLAGTLVAAQGQQVPEPGSSPVPPPTSPAPAVPQPPTAAPPQAPAAAEPSRDSDDDTTLTGCLIQGSGPTVYILDNAKVSADASSGSSAAGAPGASASADTKGQRYLLEISAPPDKIQPVLNSQVRIVGVAEKKDASSSASSSSSAASASGSEQNADEKDLPKLTAKSITRVSESCPAAGD